MGQTRRVHFISFFSGSVFLGSPTGSFFISPDPVQMKRKREQGIEDLPPELWEVVTSTLGHSDLMNLLFTNKWIRTILLPRVIRRFRFDYSDELARSWIYKYVLTLYINDTTLPAKLPQSLQKLSLTWDDFDQPLDNLPSTLVYLSITSERFNQPLDNLPSTLVYSSITSERFNQPLDKLPSTLKDLMIDSRVFDQPLDNLPSGLGSLYITVGKWFNYPIDKLPPNLKCLTIRSLSRNKFNQPVNKLPLGITTLIIRSYSFNQPVDSLPTGLKYLCIDDGAGSLTNSRGFDQPLDNLPSSLENLLINGSNRYNNIPLPKGLKYVSLNGRSQI